MKFLKTIAVVLAVAMPLLAMAADDDDAGFNAVLGFSQLRLGFRGDAVKKLIGQEPQSQELTKAPFITIARWRWAFADGTRLVVVLAGRNAGHLHMLTAKKCINTEC